MFVCVCARMQVREREKSRDGGGGGEYRATAIHVHCNYVYFNNKSDQTAYLTVHDNGLQSNVSLQLKHWSTTTHNTSTRIEREMHRMLYHQLCCATFLDNDKY